MDDLLRSITKDVSSRSLLPDLAGEGMIPQAIKLLPYIPNILVKLGSLGVLMVRLCPKNNDIKSNPNILRINGVYVDVVIQHFPGLEHEGVVSVNGAGYALNRTR